MCKIKINKLILLLLFSVYEVSSHVEVPSLGQCLKSTPNNGLLSCAGQQALYKLQDLEEMDQFNLIDGLKMIKDEKSSRSIANFLDKDPMNFRNILESAGAVISQRSLQWDMSMLYPGLTLRVGPSVEGPGVLEFVMDTNLDRGSGYQVVEEESTARVLTKQFVLPFLLGFKFNLASLLPLIFGALIILSKKALLLGKLALLISGIFGLGSIFSPSSYGGSFFGGGGGGGGYYPHHHGPSYHYKDQKDYNYRREDNVKSDTSTTTIRPVIDNFYKYEDQLYFRDRLERLFDNRDEDAGMHRNFAWQTTKPK